MIMLKRRVQSEHGTYVFIDVLVNLRHIIYATASRSEAVTMIMFANGEAFAVQESPRDILMMRST